ncbi:hypothetical protein T484DRAFT_2283379 [Baffinella frigidus]|nr:hypothetical protein T484DRAFT_2283379 [Cryptophyta sp. CCMP2293]
MATNTWTHTGIPKAMVKPNAGEARWCGEVNVFHGIGQDAFAPAFQSADRMPEGVLSFFDSFRFSSSAVSTSNDGSDSQKTCIGACLLPYVSCTIDVKVGVSGYGPRGWTDAGETTRPVGYSFNDAHTRLECNKRLSVNSGTYAYDPYDPIGSIHPTIIPDSPLHRFFRVCPHPIPRCVATLLPTKSTRVQTRLVAGRTIEAGCDSPGAGSERSEICCVRTPAAQVQQVSGCMLRGFGLEMTKIRWADTARCFLSAVGDAAGRRK